MNESISNIITEELDILLSDVKTRLEQSGQVATGKTRDSFNVYLSNPYTGVLEGAAYAGVLERGRGPAKGGGSSSNSDFIENLKQWIVARNWVVKDAKDLEQKAKFLKWYLNKFGSWAFRNNSRTDIFTTPIEQFKKRITERVSNYYTTQIDNQIFNK